MLFSYEEAYNCTTMPHCLSFIGILFLAFSLSANGQQNDEIGVIRVSKPKTDEQYLKVFAATDEPASFPGGDPILNQYILSNLTYPAKAKKDKLEGTVLLQLTIDENGLVSEVKVSKSLTKECDLEAVRLVKNMPYWNPARSKGTAVRSFYTLPIRFSLLE